jgi:hypothetical protein
MATRTCDCGNQFSISFRVEGKRRYLKNRTKCFNCSPFVTTAEKKRRIDQRPTRSRTQTWYQTEKDRLGVDPITYRRESRKSFLVCFLGGACQECGYQRCVRNLTFHHLSDKQFALSSREFQNSLETVIPEASKCVILCHNCHGEVHEGLLDYTKISDYNRQVRALLQELEGKTWKEVVPT